MDPELQQVFNYVVSSGVNLFDTADSYGKPVLQQTASIFILSSLASCSCVLAFRMLLWHSALTIEAAVCVSDVRALLRTCMMAADCC